MANGHMRGSLKDFMNRNQASIEVESPRSIAVQFRDGSVPTSEEVDAIATLCGAVNRGKVNLQRLGKPTVRGVQGSI